MRSMPMRTLPKLSWPRARTTSSSSKKPTEDTQFVFSEPTEPHLKGTAKGHGRLERWAAWVSSELAGYRTFPGLSNVIKVSKKVKRLKRGEWVESEQYAMTSLADIDSKRALSLAQGHWGIENRFIHVEDDSFGEDRHVMRRHGSGAVISLLRNVAITLLRGVCSLWSSKEPLTDRAHRLGVQPTVALLTP